ncbi:apolipoprotein N-acyltransferase [Sulfurospirillum sp. 1307]|jgi:apolipoprotein N-acyltransferase
MQIYLNRLAYESFYKKFSKNHSSTFYIIKGFFIAFSLSIFIYLDYFSFQSKIINSIFAFIGFYTLLKAQNKTLPWIGFFLGIFWFYWISLSFRFYDLPYLIPFVIIGIGLIYGFIFWIISKLSISVEIRAILLLALSFFEPFGFNWLKLELLFINSYFSTNLYMYTLFLAFLVFLIRVKKPYNFIFLIAIILLPFSNNQTQIKPPNLNIALADINLEQDKKWDKKYQQEIIETNFLIIKKAIQNKKDLIILPESAFPLYLNLHVELVEKLKKLSHKISIITGGLRVLNEKVYNSSYMFQNGDMKIANKVVLVPFGEKIALPKFMARIINKIFFNGAEDYESAKDVTDFDINGYKFRNAICYEATSNELFKNNPRYMVAISNNAWFKPSIEPTLQKLLLKYYARKYNTIIYHSANGGINAIITP